MKKILLIICILVIFPVKAVTNTYVSSLNVTSNELEETGYVYVDLNINSDFLLKGFSMGISYDKSKLELLKITDEDKFDITFNNNYSNESSYISGVYNKGRLGQFTVSKLVFKKTDNFLPGNKVIIQIENPKGSDDTIGTKDSFELYIPGIMNIKNIKINGNDILNNKEYITEEEEITITSDVEYGIVLYGLGNKKLNLGNNEFNIIYQDEKNNQTSININIIRQAKESKENIKDDSNKTNEKTINVNNEKKHDNKTQKNIEQSITGDNIVKYFFVGIGSIISLIFITFFIKKILTKR